MLILLAIASIVQQRRGVKTSGKHNSSYADLNSDTNKKNKQHNLQSEINIQDTMDDLPKLSDGDEITNGEDISNVVYLTNDENNICHDIVGSKVKIVTSAGSHHHGSSKVKIKSIVDYKWEVKNYPGHLVAVHLDKIHLAYVINVSNKVTGWEAVIRVVNIESGARTLIKGMCGEVLDMQFAHIEKHHILAIIDVNSLFVYDINQKTFSASLMLKIEDPLKNYVPKYDKVSWCPYVDVPDEDDDASQLLVWARGTKFQCFNVNTILKEYGENGVVILEVEKIDCGYVGFSDDEMCITWVALSPDGSTLGVGCMDGVIRFYQVYMHEPDPRCLHQWKPHDGKPISSFFFLDNLTKNISETYWKFAITCAMNNTEFKVWDCGTWACLQTINIESATLDQKPLYYKVEIDRTAGYLVLCSLEKRTCSVFQIANNGVIPIKTSKKITDKKLKIQKKLAKATNDEKIEVSIKSISEFPLNTGILSFSIVDAGLKRIRCPVDNYECEELDDNDDDPNSLCWIVLHLITVQSNSMQDCRIIYMPSSVDKASEKIENSMDNDEILDTTNQKIKIEEKSVSTESNALEAFLGIGKHSDNQKTNQNTSPNISIDPSICKIEPLSSRESSPMTPTAAISKGFVNLMTPDAFSTTSSNSGGKKTPECVSSDVRNTILMLASAQANSITTATMPDNINILNLVNNKMIEDQEHQKMKLKQSTDSNKFHIVENSCSNNDNLASGGSSPSREVQEIMSLLDYDKSPVSGDELTDDTVILNTQMEDITLDGVKDSLTDPEVLSMDGSNWSKSSDIHNIVTSVELQNAANVITQAVNSTDGANIYINPPTIISGTNLSDSNSPTSGFKTQADVHHKLNHLIDLVKHQSIQINSLQNEIIDLKKRNQFDSSKTRNDYSFKLEMQLSKMMELYLKRFVTEHKKKLATFINTCDTHNREIRDTINQHFNQNLIAQFGEIVMQILSFEINRQVGPILDAKLQGMREILQKDVSHKFSTLNNMIKENVTHICQNKAFVDAFGKSVLDGVESSFQTAFIESMSVTLIPAYEKSSQNMFKQLHEAFSGGIKECKCEIMHQFEMYIKMLVPLQTATEEAVGKFSGTSQLLDTMFKKHCQNVTEIVMEIRKEVKNLELGLLRHLQDSVRTEVRRCFEAQVMSLRSQSATPAQPYDLKDVVKHFLSQGCYNKAFHQALLANDLSLVEYTLKNSDPSLVFNPTCCLEQKVLLSLIQQISADMSNHNEIKQNYLAEALLAINPSDPISREHAPKVLQDLYRNCQAFHLNYPKSPQCSNVRMLMKAVESFKDQF